MTDPCMFFIQTRAWLLKSPEALLNGRAGPLLLSLWRAAADTRSPQSRWCPQDARNRDRILQGTNCMKSKPNSHAFEIEAGSASPSTNASIWSSANLMEEIWDALFALATATAIYLGVASLAGHLNEAQA